jgi:hypothetical protein
VGFVVDEVALGQVFFEYFGFPCQIIIPPNSPSSYSPEAGTIDLLVIPVPRLPNSIPPPFQLRKNTLLRAPKTSNISTENCKYSKNYFSPYYSRQLTIKVA